MARIFISYRRDDTAGHAGRLGDALVRHFSETDVFMDIDAIQPGADFVDAIKDAVGACDVLLVLIGREWLTASDAEGRRRLENPNDYVRLEVATGLERGIRVIPVLVEGAEMPAAAKLPDDLAKLARRNAMELRDNSWHRDIQALIEQVHAVLSSKASPGAGLETVALPSPQAPSRPDAVGSSIPRANRKRRWLFPAVIMVLGLGLALLGFVPDETGPVDPGLMLIGSVVFLAGLLVAYISRRRSAR